MGPWGGVLYPLGMRVSPTRPHLGLSPHDPASAWKMWSRWDGETSSIQPSLSVLSAGFSGGLTVLVSYLVFFPRRL